MTGSDLNSSSKPWDVQWRTAQIVYAEFHEQVEYFLCIMKYVNYNTSKAVKYIL